MHSFDRQDQVERQRHHVGSKHLARSASGDLRFNGQTIKAIIHPLSNENHAKKERLCQTIYHQQKNKREQHQ
jgi:hypothetical protein